MRRRGFRLPKIRMRRPRLRRPSRDTFRRMVPRRGGGWGNLTLPAIGLGGLLALFLSGSVLMKGCSGNKQSLADKDSNGDQSTTEVALEDHRIPGNWNGRAGINLQKVNGKLQNLPPAQANFLKQLSDEHLNTQITASFESDGSMIMEVQSSPPLGQVTVNRVTGVWKVLKTTDEAVTLDLEFTRASDGIKKRNQITFQFIDGNDLVAMVAPTGPELSDCEPIYVFRRSNDTASVAQQPGNLFNK